MRSIAWSFSRGRPSALLGLAILFPLALLQSTPVRAALTGSWVGDFSIPAFDGRVNACTIFDGVYIVGGDFRWAGSERVSNVAMWAPAGSPVGNAWTPVGLGLPSPVRRLVVWNGDLLAATNNHVSGTSPVMRFDGNVWQPLGAGIYGEVEAMLADGTDLYIAGPLLKVGDIWAFRVLRWDGAQWQDVGGGFDYHILSLAKYQGELYAGGDFLNAGNAFVSRIARWDGSQWNAVGGGTAAGGTETVAALAEYNGRLIAGGVFEAMGGVENTRGIAAWDGNAWEALPNRPQDVLVRDLQVEGSVLHVAGVLQVPNQWAAGLATFDGQVWQPPTLYPDWSIDDIAIGDGALIAVGEHSSLHQRDSYDAFPNRDVVVRDPSWRGLTPWRPTMRGLMGPSHTSVMALVDHQGQLIAGGYFEHAANPPFWTDRQALASWDGTGWQPVGIERVGGWVHEMLSFGDDLVVGGPGFTVRDLGSSVLSWDGSAWSDLGQPIHGWVGALASYQGRLVVGGNLQLAGTTENCLVAVHNGSGWERLGALPLHSENSVNDLASFGGSLYVAGRLSVPGVGWRGLLRWNGGSWVEVPNSPFTYADVMLVRQDALWVSGSYGGPLPSLAVGVSAWDGHEWKQLEGLTGNVRKLIEVDGTVIAAGWLYTSEGRTGLAQWDGSQWRGIPGAPVSGVEAMANVGRDLWVGGGFTRRGEAQAEAIARWRRDVTPIATPLQMSQPWPMPARDRVSFRFTLPSDGRVELKIYDLRGALVAKPVDEWMGVGTHERTWSIAAASQSIRPGVYFARLVTPTESRSARLVIGVSAPAPISGRLQP